MYTVYVLYSPKFDKIYIGYTSNLINRFYAHNKYANKGYTMKFRPWLVIHSEYFAEISEALRREKELKSSRGRDFIHHEVIPLMKSVGFISVS
jgi:putative endonuclease